MRWFWKPLSYRGSAWVVLAMIGVVAAAMMVALWAIDRLSGIVTLGAMVACFLPAAIGMLVLAPRMDRETERLLARGYTVADARKRVGRNAQWSFGLLWLVTAAWGAVFWAISTFVAPGATMAGRIREVAGIFPWQFASIGALTCWLAWGRGRVVGHGLRCGKCGYPVAESGLPLCSECGRVFVFGKDTPDGRVERPGWMLWCAIGATLVVIGITTGRVTRPAGLNTASLMSTNALIGAATSDGHSLPTESWRELAGRTVSAEQRVRLIDRTLARWEQDPAAMLIGPARTFIVDETFLGRVTAEQFHRLCVILSSRPKDSGVQIVVSELVRGSLPSGHVDHMANALIEMFPAKPQVISIASPWLGGAAGSGELSAATLARLREALSLAPELESYMWQDEVYSMAIPMLAGRPEQEAFLNDLIARATFGDAILSRWNSISDILAHALTSGWLNDAQIAALLTDEQASAAVMRPVVLERLKVEARARAIEGMTKAADMGAFRQGRNVPQLLWLVSQREVGRLTPEQAKIVDEAARGLAIPP